MMNKLITLCAFLAASLAVTACQSRSQAKDLAALILSPTQQGQLELIQIVANAIGRESVQLADDALTRSSDLIIERKQKKRIEGRLGGGREMSSPEHFKLVLSGSSCFLIHQADQARYELTESRCVLQ